MHFTAHEFSRAFIGLIPQNPGAGTVDGTGIDTTEFREALIALITGTANTGGTLDVKVQESDDDGSSDPYADVTGAAFTQVTTANDNGVQYGRLNLEDRKKWIRIVAVTATNDVLHSVVIIPSNPLNGPQSDSANVAFNV